jgi:hypothetical protein
VVVVVLLYSQSILFLAGSVWSVWLAGSVGRLVGSATVESVGCTGCQGW